MRDILCYFHFVISLEEFTNHPIKNLFKYRVALKRVSGVGTKRKRKLCQAGTFPPEHSFETGDRGSMSLPTQRHSFETVNFRVKSIVVRRRRIKKSNNSVDFGTEPSVI